MTAIDDTQQAVLDALRPGGQLSLSALAASVEKPRWRVYLAARRLRRRGLVWQYFSGLWVASPTGQVAR